MKAGHVQVLFGAALILAVAFNFSNYSQAVYYKMSRLFGDDFRHFYVGAWVLRSGEVILYDQQRFQEFQSRMGLGDRSPKAKSSPVYYAVLYPLTWLDLFQATRVFLVLNHALALLSCFLLARSISLPPRLALGAPWILFLAAVFYAPFIDNMLQGQANAVILVLTSGALYLYLRKQQIMAGALLALAACIKPFVGLLLAYHLYRRDFRLCAGAAAAAAVLHAAVGLIFGWGYVVSFLGALPGNLATNTSIENQSLAALLDLWIPGGAVIFPAAALFLLAVTLVVLQGHRQAPAVLEEYAIVILLQYLLSSYSWPGHQLGTLLSLGIAALLLARLDARQAVSPWTGCLPVAYLALACLDGFISRDPAVQALQGWALEE
ncbi:MAG TPA: glycosyltransferase family 87 protein, partial [Candidatus Nitrosotenuis sp.]|nr:glycosyltransferase family 87 protein [Candidatus Nitrosotenuis sp.]